MYEYYKGFLIREGTNGISGTKIRGLYEAVGWCDNSLPAWQNEKFEIAMNNSAWAFTVWDEDGIYKANDRDARRKMITYIKEQIEWKDIINFVEEKEYN